jgi:hypothetical protein
MHKEIFAENVAVLALLRSLDFETFLVINKSVEYFVEIATSDREIRTLDEYVDALIEMSEKDDFFDDLD